MEHVSLVVDYGNGAVKTFMGLPWAQDMTIPDVLVAAGAAAPGLEVDDFTDRGGRRVIKSLDGVEAESGKRTWFAWVGTAPMGDRLATDMSDHLSGTGHRPVLPGDVVLLKLCDDKT